jgi:hypothetical protein
MWGSLKRYEAVTALEEFKRYETSRRGGRGIFGMLGNFVRSIIFCLEVRQLR